MRRFSSGLKEIIIYNRLVKKRQATEALDGLGRQTMPADNSVQTDTWAHS